jgi:chlorobactene glucosyltransferase
MKEIILIALLLISLLLWIIYLIRTLSSYRLIPNLSKTIENKETKDFVSIIIPSRNEEHRIKKCIQTIKKQTYPYLEVIIVDDSTDDTVNVIKEIIKDDERFKIVKQKKLPNGWVGKSHAMQQGSKIAKGDWLLFIDADTEHSKDAVARAVQHAINKKYDMLSVIPNIICKKIWEKIIQPIPIGFLIFITPVGKTNDPKSKTTFALGPFIMIKKTVFEKIGGYETIKNRIGDDVEIAKLLKDSGYHIGLAHAKDQVNLRMYTSFGELWEGWSKNIFLGLVQRRKIQSKIVQLLIVLIGVFVVSQMMILPITAIVFSAFFYLENNQVLWFNILVFSSIVWLLSNIIQTMVHYKYSIGRPFYSPFYFLGGIVTIGIFLNSAVKTFSKKGVTWKGRKYN